MSVSADIRAVPRPINTIVDDNGGDGPKRYAVRERSSSKYVRGGNPQPRNGKVIGHIIDHKFVPIPEKISGVAEPDMLSYGASALVKSVTSDLKEDLLAVFDAFDVYAMMSLATLRVIKPAITAGRAKTHYLRTFVCKDYPGAAMSKNSIGSLLQRIGMNGSLRKQFYQRRMKATAEGHHIAIDGMQNRTTARLMICLRIPARQGYGDAVRFLSCTHMISNAWNRSAQKYFLATALMPAAIRHLSVTTISAKESSLQTRGFRPAKSKRNCENGRNCTSLHRSNGMIHA